MTDKKGLIENIKDWLEIGGIFLAIGYVLYMACKFNF